MPTTYLIEEELIAHGLDPRSKVVNQDDAVAPLTLLPEITTLPPRSLFLEDLDEAPRNIHVSLAFQSSRACENMLAAFRYTKAFEKLLNPDPRPLVVPEFVPDPDFYNEYPNNGGESEQSDEDMDATMDGSDNKEQDEVIRQPITPAYRSVSTLSSIDPNATASAHARRNHGSGKENTSNLSEGKPCAPQTLQQFAKHREHDLRKNIKVEGQEIPRSKIGESLIVRLFSKTPRS